jgi:Uma2 family endonuclease
MAGAAENLMTLDEFLAWERERPERYEFAHGVVTMMTGASAAHVRIAGNLTVALRLALRGSRCESFGSDMKVIASGTVRYPDLSVSCTPVDDKDDRLIEPVVIIEILSPSTERFDRGRQKLDYFATRSIRQYAIIEQDERLVDLYTRTDTGWINELLADDAILRLSSIGVEISLDAIYEDTDLDLTRRRANEAPAAAV